MTVITPFFSAWKAKNRTTWCLTFSVTICHLLWSTCWAYGGLQATRSSVGHWLQAACLYNPPHLLKTLSGRGKGSFPHKLFVFSSNKSVTLQEFHWKLLQNTLWWKPPCALGAGKQLNLVAPSVQLSLNSSGPGSKFVSKNDIGHCTEDLAKAKWNAFLVLKYFLKTSLFLHAPSTQERAASSLQAGRPSAKEVCVKSSLTSPLLSIFMNEKGKVCRGSWPLSRLLPCCLSSVFKAPWICVRFLQRQLVSMH